MVCSYVHVIEIFLLVQKKGGCLLQRNIPSLIGQIQADFGTVFLSSYVFFLQRPNKHAIMQPECEVMGMKQGEERWIDTAFDEDGNELIDDDLAKQMAAEQILLKAMPVPDAAPRTEAEVFRRRLKREMQAEALRRLEQAARTAAEYAEITDWWDRLDRNRERRERVYEVLRGDIPMEYQMSEDGSVFPGWLNSPTYRQISRGNFLDYYANCLFEMHDLTAKDYIRDIVMNLKLEHREILYFLGIRLYSAKKLAELRGQTDRNIRKVRDVVKRKIHKKLYAALLSQRERGASLTLQEKEFMQAYESFY